MKTGKQTDKKPKKSASTAKKKPTPLNQGKGKEAHKADSFNATVNKKASFMPKNSVAMSQKATIMKQQSETHNFDDNQSFLKSALDNDEQHEAVESNEEAKIEGHHFEEKQAHLSMKSHEDTQAQADTSIAKQHKEDSSPVPQAEEEQKIDSDIDQEKVWDFFGAGGQLDGIEDIHSEGQQSQDQQAKSIQEENHQNEDEQPCDNPPDTDHPIEDIQAEDHVEQEDVEKQMDEIVQEHGDNQTKEASKTFIGRSLNEIEMQSFANTEQVPGGQIGGFFDEQEDDEAKEIKTDYDKKNKEQDHLLQPTERDLFDDQGEIQPITTIDVQPDQRDQIRESWEDVKMVGTDQVGTLLMKNIFELDPSILDLYSFKDVPNVLESPELKIHYTKLLAALGSTIEAITNDQDIAKMLRQLGQKHVRYQVEKRHYNIVGRAILLTLNSALGDKFIPEVKQAWVSLIRQISAYMISDNYESFIEIENIEDTYTPERPPSRPEEQLRQMHTLKNPSNIEVLSEKRIRLLAHTWDLLKKDQNFGIKLFLQLFEMHPEALKLFSFKDTKNLDQSSKLKHHATKVTNIIGLLVSQIEVIDTAMDMFRDLGTQHQQIRVTALHFNWILPAFLVLAEEKLGSYFNHEVKDTWTTALNLMKDLLIGVVTLDQLRTIIPTLRQKEEPIEEAPPQQKATKKTPEQVLEKPKNDKLKNLGKSMNSIDVESLIPNEYKNLRGDSNDSEAIQRELTILERLSSSNQPIDLEESKTQVKKKATATTVDPEQKKQIKEIFLNKFRSEVDFHHKIQYRFEKVNRISKKVQQKRRYLNLEIIDCISEHSAYIEQDPMSIFYCLFFCIFYNNPEMIEFLRQIIEKLPVRSKTDRILEYIDIHGVSRLRKAGEQINSLVYHMVFYEAVDDNLRIVYYQILNSLKFIQLRDKDAIHLLNHRDYELIKMSFGKYTTRISLLNFYPKSFPLKAATYRRYNQAYFEEIVINNEIEERVVRNYRERFLVTAKDIYIVFEMYCKEDYDEQFQHTRTDEITHKQFIDLFILCIRNDSFKIAMLIYTLYLNPQEDMDERMLDIIMSSIKDSVRFHEIKLFFIHQHFSTLSVPQMNALVDIYQEITSRKDPQLNPMLSQYNTIKITLLIYRICWRIEERQIYSLITKCSVLQNYLVNSLGQYFQKQNNILNLYKFMSEPILHMTERKDSLDIMYEMSMQTLLQHPVVVEVLNLVYEGKYSVSSQALSMSQSFFCLLEMDAGNLKSLTSRLVTNIRQFGDYDCTKQSSLQYNIWKHSIQQREQDEMIFSILINGAIIFYSFLISFGNNKSFKNSIEAFNGDYYQQTSLLLNNEGAFIRTFCENEVDSLMEEAQLLPTLLLLVQINTIGVFTFIIQRLLTYRFKDNVQLSPLSLSFQLVALVTGIMVIVIAGNSNKNTLISDKCGEYIELSQDDKESIDKIFTLRNPYEDAVDFKLVLSVIVIHCAMSVVQMLQRTRYLGDLILALQQLLGEITRFFLTFGIVIAFCVQMLTFLGEDLEGKYSSYYETSLRIFEALMGHQDFKDYTQPYGQIYIGVFMFVFRMLLLSLLAAMFINRYKEVYYNIDAHKRFDIIRMKNSESYDRYVGGATLTFFPINIVVLPFLLPLMLLRSSRLSEFALKVQYSLMLALYCLILLLLVPVAVVLLYLKMIINSINICFNKIREDYRGQNIIQLMITVFAGPFIIIISLLIDLLSLPNILFYSSRSFEHKYQLSSDKLSLDQIKQVQGTFTKIFSNYGSSKYNGKQISLLDLMKMHVKIFSIIDNLHDLTCIGSKDSKEALSNVQDYNMTKILTHKCSVPDRHGVYKFAKCDMDIIYCVNKDISLYNYVDVLLRKVKLGTLQDQIKQKIIESQTASEQSQNAKSSRKAEMIKRAQEAKKLEQKRQGQDEEEKSDDDSNMGVMQTDIGPDGVPLKRNPTDMMNNFFIEMVARSFTDIDTSIQREKNQTQQIKAKAFQEEVNHRQKQWEDQSQGIFAHVSTLYGDQLKTLVYNLKLEIAKQANDEPPKKDDTQSTGSGGKIEFYH